MRKPGTYQLEELVSDIDGSTAYRIPDPDTAGSWERAQVEPDTGITWVAVDDDGPDDLEIGISPETLAILVNRGRVHCLGCTGECDR